MPDVCDDGRVRTRSLIGMVLAAAALVVPASALATRAPPVIHEPFTAQPCPAHPISTVDMEGCAEQRILRLDHGIDAVSRTIFARLHDDAARRRFLTASRAWLAYRRADCLSMSEQFEGGTLAAVLDARCTAAQSAQRLRELRALARVLTQRGDT